jgi:membrane protein YdbS with pleckstrin-like domain
MEKRVFRSKIGWGFVVIIGIIWGGVTVLLLLQQIWWIAALMLLLIFWISHLFLTTIYTIQGTELEVKSGFLFRKKILISEVQKIIETNNPLSSPAASLDRLEIRKSPWDYVLISPNQKEEFIQAMLEINPNIEVKRRKKN